MDKRSTEKLLILAYSAYTLALTVTATILSWPAWIVPVIIAEMLVAWVVYTKEAKDFRFRSFLLAGFTLITFGIYAAMSDSFSSILITYAGVVILLGLFGIPEIIFLEIVFLIIIMPS